MVSTVSENLVSVEVSAPSRLHFGLLDLAGATGRTYGGAGVMLDRPRVRMKLTRRDSLGFDLVKGGLGLDGEAMRDMEAAWFRLKEHLRLPGGLRVDLAECPPQHVGLGSKTALVLSMCSGTSRLFSTSCPESLLQRLSQRGGASGIGVNGHFRGGFLVDSGHPKAQEEGRFEPSSARRDFRTPPVAINLTIPSQWRFHVLLLTGEKAFGARERAFFAENTPIPAQEVLAAIGAVYHGLVPSLRDGDLPAFSCALRELQSLGFKRREIAAQPSHVQSALEELQRVNGVATGMSSMGPAIFGLVDLAHSDSGEVARLFGDLATRHGGSYLGATRAGGPARVTDAV